MYHRLLKTALVTSLIAANAGAFAESTTQPSSEAPIQNSKAEQPLLAPLVQSSSIQAKSTEPTQEKSTDTAPEQTEISDTNISTEQSTQEKTADNTQTQKISNNQKTELLTDQITQEASNQNNASQTVIETQAAAAFTFEPLTLQKSVLQVLSQNPSIYSVVQEYRSREHEVDQAFSSYLPTVDVAAGIGYEEVKTPATNQNSVELTRKELSLNIKQLLFDGFSTSNEVHRQEFRKETAKYEAFSVAENQGLRTAEVYLNVLKTNEFYLLAQETLTVHQRILKRMTARNKAGVGSNADLTQVSARMALAEGNLITAESNHRDAISNYLRVVGTFPLVDNMERPPSIADSFTMNIKKETEIALKEHPTLIAATSDVSAAQAQHSSARSTMYPKVHLELSKSFDEDIGGIEGRDEDLIIALRLRYNLYAGGSDASRKRYTSYQVENAKGIRDNSHLQVIEAMRLSFNAYTSLEKKMVYQEQHVKFALTTRDAYKKQFNLGKRTLLDVLNTENEYVSAKRDLIRSSYDRQIAEYRIVNAKGGFIASLGLSVSDLLSM
jgi:adhesin transport system outer membrane protein